MNRSNFIHLFTAVIIQVIIGFTTGNWWAGAAAGSFLFLGREHAQFEYKLIQNGERPDPTHLAGLKFWKWSTDSKLDLIFPVVANFVIAFIMTNNFGI